MACMQITITTTTDAAVDLYTLLFQGSQTGYTCNPATGICPDSPIGNIGGMVSYLSIQADPSNTSGDYILKGDARISSTCYGKSLAPGVIDVMESDQNTVHLREIYLMASAASQKANIEVHWA